ncbi:transposase [Streptomyces sp. NPDC005828]|uniref:transposase n=1 Tax=Streptomyces sp. NPDC005828 TaxID=3157071 RepID=UPI0033FFD539
MGGDLSARFVPDDLWAMVGPVLPFFRSRLQGGGTAPIDQRAVFAAVVYVLTSGFAWRYLTTSALDDLRHWARNRPRSGVPKRER